MDTDDLLTIAQAAARLGVTVSAIRNATLEGRLPFVRLFGRKLVTAEALAEYQARTQVDGVPPKGRPKRPVSREAPSRRCAPPSPTGRGKETDTEGEDGSRAEEG